MIAATTAAIPATAAKAEPAQSTGFPSYSYVGTLTPRDNPHWCLTAGGPPVHDGTPVFMLPCVKGNLDQQWFAGRVGGTGEVGFLGIAQLRLAKVRGLPRGVYLTDTGRPNPRKYAWTFFFTQFKGLWHVWVLNGHRDVYLTAPSHLKFSARKPIQAIWTDPSSPSGSQDQLWRFTWKKN